MNPFKVSNEHTAYALANYWRETYKLECEVTDKNMWFEVSVKEGQSLGVNMEAFWRNINEAFIAGRLSMAR